MRTAMTLAALLAALTLVACGGGDDEPSPTATIEATAAASQTPAANRTGIPDVDAVIDAVLARDAGTLRSLVRLQAVECIGRTPSPLGALFCEAGEREGAAIDVLPVAECETHYVREDDLDTVLQFDTSTQLYAVYRAGEEYRVVVSQRAVEDGPLFGVTVGVEAGRITYIDFGCGQTAAQLLQNVAESDFLIAPSFRGKD